MIVNVPKIKNDYVAMKDMSEEAIKSLPKYPAVLGKSVLLDKDNNRSYVLHVHLAPGLTIKQRLTEIEFYLIVYSHGLSEGVMSQSFNISGRFIKCMSNNNRLYIRYEFFLCNKNVIVDGFMGDAEIALLEIAKRDLPFIHWNGKGF